MRGGKVATLPAGEPEGLAIVEEIEPSLGAFLWHEAPCQVRYSVPPRPIASTASACGVHTDAMRACLLPAKLPGKEALVRLNRTGSTLSLYAFFSLMLLGICFFCALPGHHTFNLRRTRALGARMQAALLASS